MEIIALIVVLIVLVSFCSSDGANSPQEGAYKTPLLDGLSFTNKKSGEFESKIARLYTSSGGWHPVGFEICYFEDDTRKVYRFRLVAGGHYLTDKLDRYKERETETYIENVTSFADERKQIRAALGLIPNDMSLLEIKENEGHMGTDFVTEYKLGAEYLLQKLIDCKMPDISESVEEKRKAARQFCLTGHK